MDLRRNIICSGCGNEIDFNFNGNLDLTQMTAVGKCPSCSTTIQVDFAVVEKERATEYVSASSPASSTQTEESSPTSFPNIEDALSIGEKRETPEGILKDLME